MSPPKQPFTLANFVHDELERAPALWENLLGVVLEKARQKRKPKTYSPLGDSDDLPLMLQRHAARMSEAYLGSLHAQARPAPAAAPAPAPAPDAERGQGKRLVLELVDLDSIALDVELSKLIQAIKDEAEDELRDLQALLATLVGDSDVEQDHNPLHPAVHGRALRDAALVLPMPLAQQLGFVRVATAQFAQLLRQAYAASCARLSRAGVEPAEHRCVISPVGARHLNGLPDVAYVPDLQRIRDAMPTRSAVARPLAGQSGAQRRTDGVAGSGSSRGSANAGVHASGAPEGVAGSEPSRGAAHSGGHIGAAAPEHQPGGDLRSNTVADRQSVELVSRLFKSFPLDERVPGDVRDIIAQLRGPAMRLTLRDPSVLDEREHPIWRLIHLFAYQAEMLPKSDDPQRQQWLNFVRQTIDKLAAEPVQKSASYQAALERVEQFLRDRLQARCTALASRFDALQATEAGLASAQASGRAKSQTLDTVPAALLPRAAPASPGGKEARLAADAWFKSLVPGQWLRVLLKGAWVHAQLLWQGERGQIVLLGDGATDTTWALRRGVLTTMHCHGLAKTLQMRSLVGTAAMRVQEHLAIPDAA